MKEPSGENQEPKIEEAKPEAQSGLPEISDTKLDPKLVEEIKKEAEASLEELDQENIDKKNGRWGEPIESEVEIDGEMVKVRYREKVITLPERRRTETGITRIRRRELLPPIPEGLFTPAEESDRVASLVTENGIERGKKVAHFSTEEKFDKFYQFLTDDGYPADTAWVHSIEIGLSDERTDRIVTAESIQKFKKDGLYFQKIIRKLCCEIRNFYSLSQDFSTPVFVFSGRNKAIHRYIDSVLKNPCGSLVSKEVLSGQVTPRYSECAEGHYKLIEAREDQFKLISPDSPEYSKEFEKRRKTKPDMFSMEYEKHCRTNGVMLLNLGWSDHDINDLKLLRAGTPLQRGMELAIPFLENEDIQPLRWCHAECALIPTKRGLNVLFFETGDPTSPPNSAKATLGEEASQDK